MLISLIEKMKNTTYSSKRLYIKKFKQGAQIGLFLNFLQCVINSIILNDGMFHSASSHLIKTFHNELNATIIEFTLLMIFWGIGFILALFLEDIEVKEKDFTKIHMILVVILYLFIALSFGYIRSLKGLISNLMVFILFYNIYRSYFIYVLKKDIADLNRNLARRS